jgi:hypothetical protein
MPSPEATPSSIPEHFKEEWTKARDLIEKQDDRIHQTRTMVFGLFPTLLTAGSILGSTLKPPSPVGIGLHLTLLGLLVTGRFIEQQSYLLQAAAVSRAWVLELLTPVELTGTICDRFASGWPRRTTYIYVALGVVSLVVTLLVGHGAAPSDIAIGLGLTALYVLYVSWLGLRDIKYARRGEDWSFSTVSCRADDPVSILLVNHSDKALLLPDPAGELLQVDASGNFLAEGVVRLQLPAALLAPGRGLEGRQAYRWIWKSRPGVWILRANSKSHLARRLIHVSAASTTAAVRRPADGGQE